MAALQPLHGTSRPKQGPPRKQPGQSVARRGAGGGSTGQTAVTNPGRTVLFTAQKPEAASVTGIGGRA